MSVQSYSKLFGCNVHGSIRVSPTALRIVDTSEFQRMRGIKQLALCYFVYPAAMHTRFEHSLGVYHLAGKILEKIQQEYPDKEYIIPELGPNPIKLSQKIIECIKIAGLCHDIGHGPFSHIFDDILLQNSIHPNKYHETRSCLITEILCRRELQNEFDDNYIQFIKSIIDPKEHHRGALYQIVSNKLNGIDVDKFDYLSRDSKNLGITTGFSANRLINEFIIDNNGNIAYPKHCSSDIYEMFHSRYMMHKKVYSHKTVKIIELMLVDIFMKVDNIFSISKSIDNMELFCQLTDNTIFSYIRSIISPQPFLKINLNEEQYEKIKKANDILQNIISRNLYQQIFEIADNGQQIENDMNEFVGYLQNNFDVKLEDFATIKINVGFVSGNPLNDPFKSIYFYDKKENSKTFTIDKNYFSGLMNNQIQETRWHLICKNKDIDPNFVTNQWNTYILNYPSQR
ncbi:MAG: putative HD domain-containing protein [Satyrvirus sp.]|uniref:Putative HD domain-containing protein n=1 Tax=Satyrvirus sp. TaxID=2487771 RepID=A0A3G5AGM7_9VIRU|nr:MAG: putative HD domain-containing protein [Satyrvirus sp.]